MVLRLISCSPRRRIRSCHRHQRIWFCQTRSGSKNLRRLSISNGCQDHTVLPSASAPFVCVPSIAHGKPALRSPLHADAAASTASHPNVRDDGQRPSGGRDGWGYEVIWVRRERKYFCKGGWTAFYARTLICPSGNQWSAWLQEFTRFCRDLRASSHCAVIDGLDFREEARHFIFIEQLFRAGWRHIGERRLVE
jgi:hypothetical protein